MKLIGLTLASLIIFTVFNIVGIKKFGFRTCLSEYGKLWGDAVPIKNMNLWSIVLTVVAFLLFPPIFQATEGNVWQFVGFLAPAYLFLVIFTPNYQTDKKANIIHQIGAYTCAIGMLLWMVLIMHMWIPIVVCGVISIIIGIVTKTLKESLTYYLELSLFASTYWCLLFY